MIKLIAFDWDDVITLGSKEGYYNCYRETLKEFGITLEEAEMHTRIQKRWGQPFREELKELLAEKPELLDQACEIFDKKFWGDAFVSCLREVEGANDFLKYLSSKYTLAVATGNHPRMLKDKIIPTFQIPDVFSQIVTSFDVPSDKTKPNPLMLQIILDKHNIKPEEAVYIGDAGNDVQMAKNAGVEPIVVLTGHLKKEDAEALGVTKIYPDITYLKEIL
jgi:phosphoglycolate phosphatase